MQVTILSLEKTLFSGEANTLVVPSVTGILTILKNHMPLITELTKGRIKVDQQTFDIESGILEVARQKTTILIRK